MESDILINAINTFISKVQEILNNAKSELQSSSVELFIQHKLGGLNGFMDSYKQLYLDTNTNGRKKLEKKWSRLCRKEGVMESINALLQCEEDVDKFLEDIDQSLTVTSGMETAALQVNDIFPSNIDVVDIKSGTEKKFYSLLSLSHCNHFIVVLLRHFA